jgi:phytoene synthase
MDAYLHCEGLVRSADKDRYLAGLFAPAPARRDLYALYAFAVEIARIGDVAREPLAGEIRLQWWREVLAGERSEAAGNPVVAALLDTIATRALPTEPLTRLIDAHGRDLYGEAMASQADLDADAEATAGTLFALGAIILAGGEPPKVGLAAREVANLPELAVGEAARHAGIAYGIARRIAGFPRDAARGKIFVPDDVLARHGVARAEIEARQDSAGLRAVLAQLRDHARSAFAAFSAAAPTLPEWAAPAFLVAALVPQMLARPAHADPFAVTEVPQWRKQWTLWWTAQRWPTN